MKTIILLLVTSATLLWAQETADTELLRRLKVLTEEMVKVKYDEFDKVTVVSYEGPKIKMDDECEVTTLLTWDDGAIHKPTLLIGILRVAEDWKWLKFHDSRLMIDKELVGIKVKLDTEVFEGGRVYEALWMEVPIEDAAKMILAQEVKMKIGLDQWTFDTVQRAPVMTTVARWLAEGGKLELFKDRLREMIVPNKGETYAEVVRVFGEPVSKEARTGWAVWGYFEARFDRAKVEQVRRKQKTAP